MTESLGYDALNRLTSVSSGAESESYLYDADGNRLSQNINGVSTTFTIDASSNRLLRQYSNGWNTSYGYDPEGDVVKFQRYTDDPAPNPPQNYYYTGFDRLNGTYIGGVSTHFDVNPEGQRLRKYTSTTDTYFAPDMGGNLLAEETNGAWTDYVWLSGRLIAVLAKGQVYSVHDDQTGRPQVMAEPNGTSIDWAAQNKPFDRTVTTNAWGPFNIGFPGQYYDSEDSLWYNGHRDYDATLGRYIESDPIGLQGGVNTYVYANNDPVSNIDPLGLICPPSKVVVLYNKTINMGSYSIFTYQLEDVNGTVLDGPGYSLAEDTTSQSPIITSNFIFNPVINGTVQDIIGWNGSLPTANQDIISSQSFIAQYKGQQYTLTTVLQHDSQYINGAYNNTVTVVHQ